MEKLPKTTIVVISGYTGDKLVIHTGNDCNLEDYQNHFKTILTFLTFGSESIDEMFAEEY